MKIVFITSGILPVPAVQGGAVETLTDALATQNELSTNNIKFVFLTIQNSKSKKTSENLSYKKSKYQFISVPKFVILLDRIVFAILNNIFKVRYASKFRFLLQRVFFIFKCHLFLKHNPNYQKVIVQNHPSLLVSIYGTKYVFNKNVIYYAHNDISNSFFNRILLNKCSEVICVSKYLESSIKNKISIQSIHKLKFKILKNGIDTSIFFPFSSKKIYNLREQLGYNKNDIVILFIGRLIPEKGIEQLISAFNNVSSQNSCLKLLIIGSTSFALKVIPEFEKKLYKLAEKNANIKFTGFISNNKLPIYYNIADIVVLPSIWEEPAGLTMLEAQACGRPLITTNSGGIPEYISEKAAILLNPYDNQFRKNLEDSIRELCKDKMQCLKFSNYASYHGKLFSYFKYYNDFCEVLKNRIN